MNKHIIGWDIGGAHLKAVMLSISGEVQHVLQVPCALWRGLDELHAAIKVVMSSFKSNLTTQNDFFHAITMTGELVDFFENREQGVLEISRVMDEKLIGIKQFYFANINQKSQQKKYFISFDQVAESWRKVASANWLASAELIAQQVMNGLLIDIGSTTSDFILIQNNRVACLGCTDAERMQSQELVYTGVVRTPLMAITQQVKFGNKKTAIAAEYFATAADVYRLTGDLQSLDDVTETADGKDKSALATAQRLARMVGLDEGDALYSEWVSLAHEFKALQLAHLKGVVQVHIARANTGQKLQLIGAGVGRFLAKEIAESLDLHYSEATLNTTNTSAQHFTNVCFPAYAVASLAFQQGLASA